MGQPVHLQLFAASEAAGYEAAQAALGELRRVEGALSRFDEASDLSELNRARGPRAAGDRAGPRTVLARRASGSGALTGGAFDPAVEPLMRAWGFHARRTTAPTAAELAEAREAVRAARVRSPGDRRPLASAVRPSSIWAASAWAMGSIGWRSVLRGAGIRRAFLDVSGDCLALGAPPGEPGWLVEMADPERAGRRDAAATGSGTRRSPPRPTWSRWCATGVPCGGTS